jgi:hypothetical protein
VIPFFEPNFTYADHLAAVAGAAVRENADPMASGRRQAAQFKVRAAHAVAERMVTEQRTSSSDSTPIADIQAARRMAIDANKPEKR